MLLLFYLFDLPLSFYSLIAIPAFIIYAIYTLIVSNWFVNIVISFFGMKAYRIKNFKGFFDHIVMSNNDNPFKGAWAIWLAFAIMHFTPVMKDGFVVKYDKKDSVILNKSEPKLEITYKCNVSLSLDACIKEAINSKK